jgi:hypothetical protein
MFVASSQIRSIALATKTRFRLSSLVGTVLARRYKILESIDVDSFKAIAADIARVVAVRTTLPKACVHHHDPRPRQTRLFVPPIMLNPLRSVYRIDLREPRRGL